MPPWEVSFWINFASMMKSQVKVVAGIGKLKDYINIKNFAFWIIVLCIIIIAITQGVDATVSKSTTPNPMSIITELRAMLTWLIIIYFPFVVTTIAVAIAEKSKIEVIIILMILEFIFMLSAIKILMRIPNKIEA